MAAVAEKDEAVEEEDDFEGSSAQHSQSVASTITDGATLTGAKNRLEDVVRFFSLQAHNRKLPFHNFGMLVFVLEAVQTISFALDPSFFYWTDADRAASWATATAPMRIMRVLRFFHALTGFNAIGFIVMAALIVLHFVVLATQALLVWQGKLGNRFMYSFAKLFSVFSPFITPIAISAFVLALKQDPSSSTGVAYIAVGAVCLIPLIVDVFHTAAFTHEFRPSQSKFAVTSPRRLYFIAAAKVILAVFDVVFNNGGQAGASHVLVIVYAALVFVCLAGVTAMHIFEQGFYSSLVNHIHAIVLGSSVFAGLLAFIATLCPANVGSILLIVSVVGAVPFGFLVVLLCRMRMGIVKRRVRVITQDTVAIAATAKPLRFAIDTCLATRFIWNAKHITAEEINRAEAIFKVAVRQFRHSPSVRVMFAIFLGEVRQDHALLKRELLVAKSFKPKFDIDYHTYLLSSTSKGKELSEDNDIDLMLAKLHHSAAKKAMTDFWAKVMRMRKGADPEPLLSTISSLDHHEQTADAIFKRLLSENEKSVTVLRAYAFFLQDIKDDTEQAELLFQIADEIEDAAAKARRRREARKKATAKERKGEVHVTVVDVHEAATAEVQQTELIPHEESSFAERDDDGTISTRSSSTVESSASSAERSDSRNRIIQFRTRIASAKSHAVRKILISILLGCAVMFSLVVVAFALSVVAAEKLKTQSTLVIITADAQHRMMESLLHFRLFTANSSYTSDTQLNFIIGELSRQYTAMQEDGNIWATLAKPLLVKRFTPGANDTTNVVFYENTTFLAAAQTTISDLLRVSLILQNGSVSLYDLRRRAYTRYILDNTLQKIVPVFSDFILEQVSSNGALQSFITLSLATVFPIAAIAFIVCGAAVFLPMLKGVNRERNAAISLFTEIPRSTAINMHSSCAAEKEKLEERYKSGRVSVGERNMSVVKQLTRAFWIILATMFVLAAATMLSLLLLSNLGGDSGLVTFNSANRYQALIDLAFLGNEFVLNDPTTWANETEMLDQFYPAYERFRVASENLRLKYLEASLGSAIQELLFNKPCPPNIKCTGLLELMEFFVESVLAFAKLEQNLRTRDHYLYAEMMDSYTVAHDWLQTRLEGNLAANIQAPENIKLIASLALAFGAVALLVAYVTIRPLLRSLDVEVSRGFLLMLRLPLNVLTGVEEIRTFLETGFTEFQASSKGMAEEQEQRTKVILDGSKDAVVMMNESLDITLFNPAAEALLGYNSEDVLAQPFLQLLDERTREQFRSATEDFIKLRAKLAKRKHRKHLTGEDKKRQKAASQFTWGDGLTDLQAICKDGTKVQVLISAVSAATGEGVHFAVFLKDIRTMKQHEAELQRERHRADILLKNILPEAIAETLKAHPDQTVAIQYESVTVLFADIVEFTPKAAGMTPEKLVKMLNGLFVRWDALCVEHGVEKIKTIGDCFMAACGVPVRCKDHAKRVVEFAVSMLAALEDYNRSRPGEPELKIRIGINTGSVVAGVIGKTKLQFDMWGDAVNVASRVESAGLPNRVQVSQSTYAVLKDVFPFESRGKIALKGKGEQELYILESEKIPRPKTVDAVLAAEHAEASGSAPKSTSIASDLFAFSRPDTAASAASGLSRR